MLRTMSILVLCLAASACVGTLEPVGNGDTTGGGDDTTTGANAQTLFESDVSPIVGAACAGCHTGTAGTAPLKFLGNSGTAGYYTAITGQTAVVGNYVPANAEILNQGSHDGGLAPALSTTEADTITTWLLAEADARGL
jgi:hypothetical protein